MKKKGILLIFFVIFVLTIIYWFSFRKSGDETTLPKAPSLTEIQLKPFQSTASDFAVQIPIDYSVTEKWVTTEFTSDKGLIQMGRNANDSNSLREYLQDADEKNKTEIISDKEELMVNNYPAATRVELRGTVYAKFYYIYVDDWVYVFSTESESLYSDLDQIAKSFRYTP